MNKKTIVCTHSPTLAFLLYETNCAVNNQVGLLLGNVKNELLQSATDENEANQEETTKIYIEHCIPFPQIIKFGPIGEFDEKMTKFCEKIKSNIIGWYSFRRNLKMSSPTLKDIIMHQRFLTYFKVNPENFILGLIKANVHSSRSTHGFNYKFLRYTKNTFESLKFKIYCLSDKPNGYIRNPTFPVSQHFQEIENSVVNQSAISTVKEIYKRSMETLSVLNSNLQEFETKRKELEKEVKNLRNKLNKNDSFSVNITQSTSKRENTEALVTFDPNIQYPTNGKDNPINPDIYEEIYRNVSQKSDDDVMMNEESENLTSTNFEEGESKPETIANTNFKWGPKGTSHHSSNKDGFYDNKHQINKMQSNRANSSGRSDGNYIDQRARPSNSSQCCNSMENSSGRSRDENNTDHRARANGALWSSMESSIGKGAGETSNNANCENRR